MIHADESNYPIKIRYTNESKERIINTPAELEPNRGFILLEIKVPKEA